MACQDSGGPASWRTLPPDHRDSASPQARHVDRLEIPPAPRQEPHARASVVGRRVRLSAVSAVPSGGQDSAVHCRVTRHQVRRVVTRGRQMPPSYAPSTPRVRRSAEEATANLSAVPPAGGHPRLVQGRLTGQQQANTSSDSSCDGRLPPQAKLDGTRQWANRGAAPKRVSCLRGACQPTSQERITELVYN